MSATIQGEILNISNAEHHALRALSNSGMSDLAVSPLRYWYQHINPAPKPEEEETAAMRLGSALHCSVLESDEVFESRYVRDIDPSDWPVCLDTIGEIRQWVKDKGGEAKGTKKEDVIACALAFMERIGEEAPILEVEKRRFFAQNAGKTMLRPDEWDRLCGMARAISDEPAIAPIMATGSPEVSMVARDPETGVLLKARLDWMAPKATLDLKTFTQKRGNSIDKSVSNAIVYEGYARQAYFYDYVRRLVTGERPGEVDFVYVFVESDQPHETRLRRLVAKSSHSVNLYWESARIEVQRLIRTYADCLARFGDDPWRDKQEIARLTDEDVPQFSYGGF